MNPPQRPPVPGRNVTGDKQLDPRRSLSGGIDFTMMYAAHDAFSRDLQRLLAACAAGASWRPADRSRWARFSAQLHVHHHAEDEALWPPLRKAAGNTPDVSVLDAMEREHAAIDPYVTAIDRALAADAPAELAAALARLDDGLADHMRHEENNALPLIEKYLGPPGWKAFTATFRETQGIRGAATYFPWLLDGAPDDVVATVLSVLPAPARLLYRMVWAPRYQRAEGSS